MAEVASIIAFASTGFKLSMTLFSFASAIGSAGQDIVQTGKDIAVFSAVLRQLGLTMKRAHKGGLISDDAFQDTALIIAECRKIFTILDGLIAKATSTEKIKVIKMEGDDDEVKELDRDNLTVSYGKRLMYLFRKSEILEQKKALESLKSSLQLLLQVMMFTENKMQFTEDVTDSTSMDSFMAEENLGLESLVLANQAATTEYRKQKPRAILKKDVSTTDSNIISFGIIGQLSQPQTTESVSPPSSSGSESHYSSTNVGFATPPATSASEPHNSKSSSLLSLIKPKPAKSEDVFVIVPPSLKYNSDGNLAPYPSSASLPATPLPYYPLTPPTSHPAKPARFRASKSTPSAAVDMLLKRVMTQKIQQPTKHASNPTQTTTGASPSAPQQAFAEKKINKEALPSGWDQCFTATGRPYYINHNTKSTMWTMPPAASQDSSPISPVSARHSNEAEKPYHDNHNQAGPDTDGYFPQSPGEASNYRTPDVEEVNDDDGEDEEPIIDLYPRREARPY